MLPPRYNGTVFNFNISQTLYRIPKARKKNASPATSHIPSHQFIAIIDDEWTTLPRSIGATWHGTPAMNSAPATYQTIVLKYSATSDDRTNAWCQANL
jgi:hypothetical protein